MDMYQKRKIRAEKKNNDNDKSKVRLNWYPGHMEKTKKQINMEIYSPNMANNLNIGGK